MMVEPSKQPIDPSDLAHCTELVRQKNRDQFLSNLLLPAENRGNVAVLNALDVELATITQVPREPLAGEMRLRWWAEVLAGERAGEANGHPVARPLLAVCDEFQLSKAALVGKVEAHIFELYGDPMGNRSDFEGWCGETRSVCLQMSALMCGVEQSRALADGSGHGGVALGIIWVLENFARHIQKQQVFVPKDLVAAAGLGPQDFSDDGLSEKRDQFLAVASAMLDLAEEHSQKAITALEELTRPERSVFRPFALVPLKVAAMRRDINAVLEGRVRLSAIRRQWALWRAPFLR